jgi:hypothetical protein
MSDESRIKKLRGSGGYVLAVVTDDQQRKGNLGGPDLFLAPIGRLDADHLGFLSFVDRLLLLLKHIHLNLLIFLFVTHRSYMKILKISLKYISFVIKI